MALLNEIKTCRLCEKFLPLPPRPVVQFNPFSRIIIVGQAPGLKVHKSGIPWDDASGDRLRSWLGVNKEQFYNPDLFGIVPMGFCYPGRGKSGDLPPRRECAPKWMPQVLQSLEKKELILLVGQYAQKYFLGCQKKETLTETVRAWEEYLPNYLVLPHPSPRNNIWLKKNSWFVDENIEAMRQHINKVVHC